MLAFAGSALAKLTEGIALTQYIAQRVTEMRKTLGRYLTDEIIANILETLSGLKLGEERRKVMVLVSDLRELSAISEQLPPEEVVKILNIYLGAMTDVINQYKDTINEFVGDGIFVIFGVPINRKDDSQRAIASAIAMQFAMQQMNFSILEMGIGINPDQTGARNISSQKRAQYTVIGSDVNLAARIESYPVEGNNFNFRKYLERCQY
ncbi:adenylate/guanylate cyclase domain-containing protein [Nostoc sp.]|uniref:adenylate/guanylate cyclase domain-containing protein n=1 Tax=Nostoc sp. TaxID=1180 RepID=UPI002FF95513